MTQEEFIKDQERIHGYKLVNYLSRKEIAKRLKVSIRTVDVYRLSNDFPKAIKLPGGRVRFDEKEIYEWIQKMKVA